MQAAQPDGERSKGDAGGGEREGEGGGEGGQALVRPDEAVRRLRHFLEGGGGGRGASGGALAGVLGAAGAAGAAQAHMTGALRRAAEKEAEYWGRLGGVLGDKTYRWAPGAGASGAAVWVRKLSRSWPGWLQGVSCCWRGGSCCGSGAAIGAN
jgi:hypothetical protein